MGGESSGEAMTVRLSSAEVYDIAAKWAAKLDAGPLSEEDQAALDAWLTLDTRHQGALAKAMALLLPPLEVEAGRGSRKVQNPAKPVKRSGSND